MAHASRFRLISHAVILALLTLLAAARSYADEPVPPAGAYELDTGHGYITASYDHFGFSRPEIGFASFSVDLVVPEDAATGMSLDVTIDAASVTSRVEALDEHLRGEDFFHTDRFPQIHFRALTATARGDNRWTIPGELTIRGTTRPVRLEAELNKAAMHPIHQVPALGFSATTTVKRSDWGLSLYAPAVSDELDIRINVELLKVERDAR